MAYTVGPGKKKTPAKAKEKEFMNGFFGDPLRPVKDLVDVLNKNTADKEKIMKQHRQ